MDRRGFVVGICTLALPVAAGAQARLYRVGIVHRGGPYAAAIDGLRDGLKDLRMSEGAQYVLHVRASAIVKGVESAAAALEQEKVDVIFSVATSTTIAVKRATKSVPIVFYSGTDPVRAGLIENFSKPGGRLTGVHSRFNDLTAKRLELLKVLMPKLSRVVTFYDKTNPVFAPSVKLAREASQRLGVQLIERTVATVDDVRSELRALKRGQADALFLVSDAMVISETPAIIAAALEKKMATMMSEQSAVAQGALASYGVSYYTCARLAATYVQRILAGANPGDLPIEQIDTPHFAVNLKTADALGLKISQAVLARADEVIR